MDTPVKPPFLRTPFNYDRDKASDESGLHCTDPSLAQQQFRDESDINTLVDRFHLTGEMPQLEQLPNYADFTGIFDFQSAMNQVVKSREEFMTLPAKTRARFHNDPQEFLEFCSDSENVPEARRMGLLKPEPTPLPGDPAAADLAASERRQEASPAAEGPKKGEKPPKPPKTDTQD